MSDVHRKKIKDDLKEQFHVNDKCLDCVEQLSRTFVEDLKMTSYLFSCLSSRNGGDNKDDRQIHRLVSVVVGQHDGEDERWHFLKGNDLNKHLLDMKLKEKYKTMRDKCNSVTGKKFLINKCDSSRNYLNL